MESPCSLCQDTSREEESQYHELAKCFLYPKGERFKPLTWRWRAKELVLSGQTLPLLMAWPEGEKRLAQELGQPVRVDTVAG